MNGKGEWERIFVTTTDWTFDSDLEEHEVPVLEEYAILTDGNRGPIGHADLDRGTELVLRAEAEAAVAAEREAIVHYLDAAAELWQAVPRAALREASEVIRLGGHHGNTVTAIIPHYATLQEAHGPDSATPSASADSCDKNGGADPSPETSG